MPAVVEHDVHEPVLARGQVRARATRRPVAAADPLEVLLRGDDRRVTMRLVGVCAVDAREVFALVLLERRVAAAVPALAQHGRRRECRYLSQDQQRGAPEQECRVARKSGDG
jgi:hypothetical protein